ncbi:EAL domain-containing protein [Neobacillus sp. WH10]|uniref:bifunctional diguanylate cyclase/phosphodiesterase n=1 Tax=Neobacillus sp. WH10 TaxID=3047873 RepID=UPI0024C1C6AF|nr:GGDEF domain-containing phosphodiesterase [Neobacillus sp. WH10]WHY77036.1 EAL domain-containing protein [Neobacillus sp. WH10]
MLNAATKVYKEIPFKTWIIIVVFYLFPPLIDYIDIRDQYFHNVPWFFYLIPTLLIAYKKGTKYGGIATGVSILLFLVIESFEPSGISRHEMIIFFEMTTINLLVSILVGLLFKNYLQKQRELSLTKNLLESVFHHLDIGIWSINKSKSLLLSKGIEKIYGLSRKTDLQNNQFWKRSIHPEDLVIAEEIDKKWESQEDYEYEYRIIRPNGEIRWIRDSGLPVFNEHGEHERYDGTNVDITRQKELEIYLKESEERYKHLVENSIVGVFMIQESQLVYVNQWLAKTLGLTQEELRGTSLLDYFKEADRVRVGNHFQKLIEEKESSFVDQIQTVDQVEAAAYLEIQATLTKINGSSAIIGIALDVTDKKKAKDELEYLAYHDTLTGLPNKHYLMNELAKQFYRSTSLGLQVYILYLNLDRFKLIIDSFGHRVGDQLIQMVSNRLQDSITNGMAIRAVGDEFIIYLPNANENLALDMACSLLNALSEPYYLINQEIQVTASIGIASFEEDDDLEELVQKAGSALHFAKDFGGNQYQLYSCEIGQQVNRKLQLEQRLRKALEQNNLEVVYQPKLHVLTNRISGMEALIRWKDPILGVVSPSEFIPIAEETGMIISIGKWVLETACRQNREWEKSGYPPILVCVNISSKQFLQDDFVKMIEQVLKESDLSPEYLNLEITERIALFCIGDAIDKLQQLKQLGVSISLDDFGTGYSSMSYLKLLPVDFLKIDRSFTKGIIEDKKDLAIIDSIISLSHSLGMSVVAEGVEAENQLKVLSDLGCDEIQGYYYAKPLPVPEFKQFLDKTMVGMCTQINNG